MSMEKKEYPPVHDRPTFPSSFERLDMLWERYPAYHVRKCFATLESLLEEHESYQKDFEDEIKTEYIEKGYENFLVQLSRMDLPYRYETRKLIEASGPLTLNPYVTAFLKQFESFDLQHKACFIFPESFTTQFFVISEVCKRAELFCPINNMFPDEKIVHSIHKNGHRVPGHPALSSGLVLWWRRSTGKKKRTGSDKESSL